MVICKLNQLYCCIPHSRLSRIPSFQHPRSSTCFLTLCLYLLTPYTCVSFPPDRVDCFSRACSGCDRRESLLFPPRAVDPPLPAFQAEIQNKDLTLLK